MSTDITKRLRVSGPDSDGDYELTIYHWDARGVERGEESDFAFVTRAEADTLIVALGGAITDASGRIIAPPQPELPPRPSGPHLSNGDARKPVE